MPLNGRNFSQLSLLLPGVMTTAPDTFTEPKNFGQGRPYVNGQREQENNYTLDGVDMNEAIDNLLPYQPSPDALAEVRVETNNYSAEFGNVAGAVIGSTIKSGTNELRGSGFEDWRDSSMAANSWDNNRGGAEKLDLSQHIFGFTLGGPFMRNKLFFFGDYQSFIRDRPGEQVVSVAPEAWRRGDFSAVGVTIRDPATGLPFSSNIIPSDRFSPIARAVLADQSCTRCQPCREIRTTWSLARLTNSGPTRATSRSTRISRATTGCLVASRTSSTSRSRNDARSRASWRALTIRPSWASRTTGRAPWARTPSTSCSGASRT